jgi:hypothetical protein
MTTETTTGAIYEVKHWSGARVGVYSEERKAWEAANAAYAQAKLDNKPNETPHVILVRYQNGWKRTIGGIGPSFSAGKAKRAKAPAVSN